MELWSRTPSFGHLAAVALTLSALSGSVFVRSAHASQRNGDQELRPSWTMGQLPENSSMLYSDEDPTFANRGVLSHLFTKKQAAALREDYQERNQDYEIRKEYGVASYVDQMNHIQSVKDMGHDVLSVARNSELRPIGKNVINAQKKGEIAKPIQVVGGVAALGFGAPVNIDISKDAKACWHGDLRARHGTLDVVTPALAAAVDVDGNPGTPERYQVSVNKPLVFDVDSSVVYGGTSRTVNATLSRPIVSQLSGSVAATVPAGVSPTGTPAQETVALSYGMTF